MDIEKQGKKILGICCSHKTDKENSISWYLMQKALEATAKEGAITKSIHLAEYTINRCEGCSICMGGGKCPQLNKKGDETEKLVEEIRWSDGIIFSFPVYGLHAAGIILDFIGGRAKPFLGEELVVHGKENLGKSSLFRGKICGLIANGGGYGMEPAFMSLWPALIVSKAIPVASAGISTLEYQKVAFIENTPISKKIEDAEWANNMAASVGQRVYDALHSQAKYILEGMIGIRKIIEEEEIEIETDKHGLVWTESGKEEFNRIPVFAREVALNMMIKNFHKLGYTKITREAIIEGRKKFSGITIKD